MSIRGVSGDIYGQNFPEQKKINKTIDEKVKTADKIELSQKAKELHKAKVEGRLEEISGKVENGFYLQKNVTEKVANSILKEFTK